MLRTLLVAAAAAAALAACPNQCSGHGKCGESDKCTCFKQQGLYSPYRTGWTGADCSKRTCPLGRAYDQISTARPQVTDFTFRSGSGASEPKLEAVFVPTAQSDTFRALRSDKRIIVQIMQVSVTAAGAPLAPYGKFAWRYEEDNFFQPEQDIGAFMSATTGFNVQTAAGGNSGVFIYWDPTKGDTASFASSATQLAVGDSYAFTLTYNDAQSFDVGNSNTAHQLVECSGRGSCDGATGKCKCNAGYGGDACQRTTCPNSCSGHGMCQTQLRMAQDGLEANGEAFKAAYEAEQQYGCKCDSGYRGADCSQVECPSGPDPMGADGGAEGRDCSGRGTCNYKTGICSCFKGFYGGRCETQTTLA